MKTKCRLCEHTFGRIWMNIFHIEMYVNSLDLFNGYDKYYHYLRHYKERYQFRSVEKVAPSTQGRVLTKRTYIEK